MQRSSLIALGIFAACVVTAIAVLSTTQPAQPILLTAHRQTNATTNASSTKTLPIYDVPLPAFTGIRQWWNTPNNQALTPESLRGNVVLVDFWTYSCINCLRTLPFLRSLQERYANKGLVIVGVHTPEFAFEADPKNVSREITKNNLQYPIALDAEYSTWNAFHNRYWPAEYLFDRQGRLRKTHFGEGNYEENEAAIRSLLEENGTALPATTSTAINGPDFATIITPETYFGLKRGDAFAGTTVGREGKNKTFSFNKKTLPPNTWNLSGEWKFEQEYIQAHSTNTRFQFNVQANTLHMVMESSDGTDKHADIYVDGQKTGSLIINTSTLYDIAHFTPTEKHIIEIRFSEAGVRLYAATFS